MRRSHVEDVRLGTPVLTEESGTAYTYYLYANDTYSLILPRTIIMHKAYMSAYALKDERIRMMRAYVDSHPLDCDDILLNMLATTSSGKAPLRVSIPADSVHDVEGGDHSDPDALHDLVAEQNYLRLRSECLTRLAHFFPSFPLAKTDEMVYCGEIE